MPTLYRFILWLAGILIITQGTAQVIGLQVDTSQNVLFGDSLEGDGIKLLWLADSAAFRAGATSETGWNIENIGLGSAAFGANNRASGNGSTAFGFLNEASGLASMTWGQNNQATNDFATSWGFQNIVNGSNATSWGLFNIVSGDFSTVWGAQNTAPESLATVWGANNIASGPGATVWGGVNIASGSVATVWGSNNKAQSFGETVIGYWADTVAAANADTIALTDQLFVVGNGAEDARNNAFAILKNGNTTISSRLGIGHQPESFPLAIGSGFNGNLIEYLTTSGDLQWHQRLNSETGDKLTWVESGVAENRLVLAPGNKVGINVADPSIGLQIHTDGLTVTDGIIPMSGGGLRLSTDDRIWDIGVRAGVTDNDLLLSANSVNLGFFDEQTGLYNVTSDKRSKKNIKATEHVLDRILQLRPIEYQYKRQDDSDRMVHGFVAQEVLPYFPHLVSTAPDGYLGINYSGFGVIAIRGIQEQQAEIQSLRSENDAIKEDIIRLENEREDLLTRVLRLEKMMTELMEK